MLKISPEKVIFDMDGLIFDTENLFMRELGKVMAEGGYTLTRERYVKTLGLTGEILKNTMLEYYGSDYPHAEMSRKARASVDKAALNGELTVKPGIRDLLVHLKEKGIPCAVASSTHTVYVEKYLTAAGLRGYFDEVIGGEMAARSKPAPDIFLKALNGTKPVKALVLEDSENGIKAAHAAGIPVICIPDMVYPSPECEAMTVSVVNSAADVVNMLDV